MKKIRLNVIETILTQQTRTGYAEIYVPDSTPDYDIPSFAKELYEVGGVSVRNWSRLSEAQELDPTVEIETLD